jgi:hypothetical protein
VVRLSDTYTFEPTELIGERLWRRSYSAARYLEKERGYKPFNHSNRFEVTQLINVGRNRPDLGQIQNVVPRGVEK